MVAVERLPEPTLAALQRRLRRGEYHIFHFIGHGAFDERAQDGVLLMEDEARIARAVGGQELGMLLHDHSSLRLAILNACEGARASRTDPFAGVAQSLVQQGIPAVIAMQFEVADETAILFAHEFYGAVADGYPVDTALAEARKAIFARGDDLEWGTPVLYMRAPDGRIFDVVAASRPPSPPPPPPKPRADAPRKLEETEIEALEAYYRGDWARAVELYREVLALKPDRPGAAAKLAAATRNQTLDENYVAGRQAYDAGNWPAAIEKLQAVLETGASYRDAAALLAEAKRRAALSELYAEARLLAGAGSWEAVVKVFERMATLDPAALDPDGLQPLARQRLAAAEQERKLAGLYAEGLRGLDAGQSAEAIRQFEAIQALSPGYRQAGALLARARQELDALRAAEERQAVTEKQAAERRRTEVNDLYEQASACFRRADWAEAERLFGQLLALQPHYRDAETLLVAARDRLAAQRATHERAARETAALPPPPTVRPGKPTTLPEEIKPRPKPKDLPH